MAMVAISGQMTPFIWKILHHEGTKTRRKAKQN